MHPVNASFLTSSSGLLEGHVVEGFRRVTRDPRECYLQMADELSVVVAEQGVARVHARKRSVA